MTVYCPVKVFHRIKLNGRNPFIRLQCSEGRTKMVPVEGLAIDGYLPRIVKYWRNSLNRNYYSKHEEKDLPNELHASHDCTIILNCQCIGVALQG